MLTKMKNDRKKMDKKEHGRKYNRIISAVKDSNFNLPKLLILLNLESELCSLLLCKISVAKYLFQHAYARQR
jgi:hypothetical protein